MSKIRIIVLSVLLVALLAGAVCLNFYFRPSIDFGEIILSDIPEKAENTRRIMSFNVRRANDPQGSVSNRSQLVTAVIEQYEPDSFGVQEATPRWLSIIDNAVGDKYARVGRARDLYGPFGEYACVYYLRDKYELLDSGTFWLSETPEKPYTKSFDSICLRAASWAMLKDKETGLVYTHVNSHLDHTKTEYTRVGQAGVLMSKLDEFRKQGNVCLTIDLNTYVDSDVYASVLERFDDAGAVAFNTQKGITFHNYGRKEDKGQGPIDFVFTSKGTKVATYKIITDTFNGMYPSDHYPIIADLYFE